MSQKIVLFYIGTVVNKVVLSQNMVQMPNAARRNLKNGDVVIMQPMPSPMIYLEEF